MCGIAGIINTTGNAENRIQRMLSVLRHRGPDASGICHEEHVALGHTRLRILDLNPHADQPMSDNKGNIRIVFNGEIYNYRELKKEITGYEFRTQCDTEVLIAAYEKWGIDCVSHFNGMFSFVLYDKKNRIIFGARDRFGIKPFYYTQKDGEIIFASEIKSLLTQTGKPSPNYPAMMEWMLTSSAEHKRDTFFKGINQLLPGEAFTFSEGAFSLFRYYDLKDHIAVDRSLSAEESHDKFMDILTSSVRYRLQSDVPVGVYFSGGLDSTTIAAIIKNRLNMSHVRPFTAYSSTITDKSTVSLLDRMAGSLNLDLEFCDVESADADTFLRRLMWHMEMPFAQSNVYDDVLNRKARERGTVVVLEGQGSDEAQAGYFNHYVAHMIDLFFKGRWINFLSGFKQAQWPQYGPALKRKVTQKILNKTVRRPARFLKNSSGHVRRPDALKYLTTAFVEEGSFIPDSANVSFDSHLHYALYEDMYKKLQRVLRYKDRISMAYSRELRVPFLDHRLVEFMFSIPNEYKIRNGTQKLILKQAISGLIPSYAIELPKNAFMKNKVSPDFSGFINKQIFAMVSDSKSRDRGLFHTQQIVNDYNNNGVSGALNLWRLGQIELWFRTFVDNDIDYSASFGVSPLYINNN